MSGESFFLLFVAAKRPGVAEELVCHGRVSSPRTNAKVSCSRSVLVGRFYRRR